MCQVQKVRLDYQEVKVLTVDVEKEEIKDSEVSKETRVFWDPQVDMDKKGNRENKDLLATKDQKEK